MTDPQGETLTALAARARLGGEADMHRLLEKAYPVVRRFALIQCGDPVDADDLTQDVLIRMVRRLDTFRGDARLETWLYSMARNGALDRARRAGRRERRVVDPLVLAELAPDTPADPAGRVEAMELRSLLELLFSELPERQRTAFDLVELQGMSAAEAAEVMGLEPVSVRAHLFKARRGMRERIIRERPEVAEEYR